MVAFVALLRSESLSYNLLGDPACPLRAPLPMAIRVGHDGEGRILASGHTPPGCTSLRVDLLGPGVPIEDLPPELPPEERSKRLDAANEGSAVLVMKHLSRQGWRITVDPPPEYFAKGAYLRFLLFGRGEPYYHVLQHAAPS